MYRHIFLFVLVLGCCIWGCSGNDDGQTAVDTSDTGLPTDNDTGQSTDSAETDTDMSAVTQCGALFGAPGEQTGLTSAQCVPECHCNGMAFLPTQLTDAQLDRLAAMTLDNPPPLLSSDPYAAESAPAASAETAVCGVTISDTDGNAYRLDTFNSSDEAIANGATVTHYGACGQCSALADLVVYMKNPDLTAPVRQCGVEGMTAGGDANIRCLMALGYTEPCAQIWYYNTVNTRTLCLETCAPLLAADYHLPSGALNACLQCDEDNSGAVFKAVAGRTRRNSGLPSGICRPCETIRHVVHVY